MVTECRVVNEARWRRMNSGTVHNEVMYHSEILVAPFQLVLNLHCLIARPDPQIATAFHNSAKMISRHVRREEYYEAQLPLPLRFKVVRLERVASYKFQQ